MEILFDMSYALLLLSACVHEHLHELEVSNLFIHINTYIYIKIKPLVMPICTVHLLHSLYIRCQAKFLTSRHVRMHRVVFYISKTLRKLMIRALGLVFR